MWLFVQQYCYDLVRSGLVTNFIIVAVARALYLVSRLANHGYHAYAGPRGEFVRKGMREGGTRILLQVPVVLVGALGSWLALGIAGYSLVAAGTHVEQAVVARKSVKDVPYRGFRTGTRLLAVVGVLEKYLLPGALVVVGVLLGMVYELLALGAGIGAYLATRGRLPARSVAASRDARRTGAWASLPKAARVGLVTAAFVGPSLLLAGAAWASTPVVSRNVMVPVGDGVALATDVYLPRLSPGPHPVILYRTPYNKDGQSRVAATYASMGYAFVAQDLRGRFASSGSFSVFRDSRADGAATVWWILNQSWCDGRVATQGMSADCINQYTYASEAGAGLRAQYLFSGTPDVYGLLFTGGAYRRADFDAWFTAISFDGASPGWNLTTARAEVFAHPTRGAFWDPVTYDASRYARVGARAIHLNGWFDMMVQGTLDGFVGYQTGGTTRARGNQTLVVGPWSHGTFYATQTGQMTFPASATNKTVETMWFDLLAAELWGDAAAWRRYQAYPRVNYYLMGPSGETGPFNEWRYADAWPLPDIQATPLYLHANGSCQWDLPTTLGERTYDFDPRAPVPTIGGNNLGIAAGPYDQRALETRSDVLVYSTPVLTTPVEVAGPITARLHVASNCTDTDFVVKLLDVYPDGRAIQICEGMARARYREGADSPQLLIPGVVTPLTVDLWSTAYHFPAGHRVRVLVTSSNAPRFDVNPNTGAPLQPEFADYATVATARNTVHHGPAAPSQLLLPCLPAAN